MIRISTTILLVILATRPASGQTPTVTVNDLSAPVSPAFTLLGISPASVDKPDTPKSFVLNAINRITGNKSGIPKDIAMQITPYWMKSHPRLTFREYQEPSIGQSIAQSLSIAVATSPIAGLTREADPLGTHVALGFTFRPWNGQPNPSMDAKVAVLEALADKVLDRTAKIGEPTEEALAQLEKDLEALQPQITAAARAVADLNAHRVGFFLTLAGGQVWDFPGDDTGAAQAKRRGAWVTAAYRMLACPASPAQCLATIDAIAVGRSIQDAGSDAMIDVGGRLVWSPTQEFSASVEFLRRKAPGASATESTENSNRTAGILEYKINETASLFGTFGQDFKKATGAKPLISLIGLNVGFGRTPTAKAEAPAKK